MQPSCPRNPAPDPWPSTSLGTNLPLDLRPWIWGSGLCALGQLLNKPRKGSPGGENAYSPRKLLQQATGVRPRVFTTDHSYAFSSDPQWTIGDLLVALNLQIGACTWNGLRKKLGCCSSLVCSLWSPFLVDDIKTLSFATIIEANRCS